MLRAKSRISLLPDRHAKSSTVVVGVALFSIQRASRDGMAGHRSARSSIVARNKVAIHRREAESGETSQKWQMHFCAAPPPLHCHPSFHPTDKHCPYFFGCFGAVALLPRVREQFLIKRLIPSRDADGGRGSNVQSEGERNVSPACVHACPAQSGWPRLSILR